MSDKTPSTPHPPDEIRRLEALHAYRILDTDPEDCFDRITRFACRVFRVPIALVSLVDEEREWFKARCGWEPTEAPREESFCAHAILQEEPMLVEDAAEDPRFRRLPLVAEEGIRFYAGVPLRNRDGHALGALCIKDHEPRSFGSEELRLLEGLAEMIMDEMEHRLLASDLRKWEHVFGHAGWGIAVAEEGNPSLSVVNPTFAAMHGYSVEECVGMDIRDLYPPELRGEVEANARKVREKGRHIFDSVHIRKDGSRFPVQIDATAVRDSEGNLILRAANIQDISERRGSEEELRFRTTILATQQEVSPDGILVVDPEGKIISFNQRFVELWGLPPEVLETRRDDLALDYALKRLEDPDDFLDKVRYLYEHPEESSSDELTFRDGRVIDRFSAPMIGPQGRNYGRVWFFRDDSERRAAERAVRESEERLSGILESAMDAILTLDQDGKIRFFNAAAESVFRCPAAEAVGSDFSRFTTPALAQVVDGSMKAFRRKGARKRYVWAPEGVSGLRADGEEFPLEATISHTEVAGEDLFTIILRDVNERVAAEEQLARLEQENIYLREEISGEGAPDIIAASDAMKEVLQAAEQVAGTDTTVLITGETGTGKGVVASVIHQLSERSERILVTVNCAALPAGLIESELFGHEKGAFTGALRKKVGRFQLADGGTLFLDEIGDLPPELQAKLLRVLQEGEFERVGSSETIRVDVRVIAATNQDLEESVAEERFRADLFYRLNVFPLEVPPLRDRPEDIPPLVRLFVKRYASKMGKELETIPRATLHALRAYPWPGNVRELQNVLERAVILSRGSSLEVGDWIPRLSPKATSAGALTLEEVQRRHILEILEQTGWKVGGPNGAAEILGLPRTTLTARMKKLGIERPSKRAPVRAASSKDSANGNDPAG